jgi:uncharacterized repeat protein (TIGR01451 family)
VAWTLVATNRGAAPLSGLTVMDTLPAGVPFVSQSGFANGGGTITPAGVVTWTDADPLAPGESVAVAVAGTFACGAGANTAQAFARDACGTVTSAPRADRPAPPRVTVAASHDIPPGPAEAPEVVFRVVVTNAGTATITRLRITDTLPGGFTARTLRGPASLTGATTGRVASWEGTVALAPGGSVTVEAAGAMTCGAEAQSHVAGAAAEATCAGEEAAAVSGPDDVTLRCPPLAAKSSPAAVEPSLACGQVKLVGGIRGFLDPRLGEQATILLRTCTPGPVSARIMDEAGRLMAEFSDSDGAHGVTTFRWNLRDASGAEAAPGIYPVLVEGPDLRFRGKLAVLH